jgi:hypothetical protein
MLTLILYAIILQSPKSAAINETMKIRAAYWRVGTETAKRNVLFGIGLNQLRRSGKIKYDDSHAHNQFIHTAAEIGIPGLLSYIAILIGVFWMAGEVARSSLPAWMLLNCRGLAAGQLGFAIFGLVDAVPLGAKAGLFFWISIALITSIYLYARNEGLLMKSLPETGAVSGPAISHV